MKQMFLQQLQISSGY